MACNGLVGGGYGWHAWRTGQYSNAAWEQGLRRLQTGGKERKQVVRLRIATRRSALALWQARHVADGLRTLHTGIEVEIVGVVTEGDRNRSPSLAAAGGKGLFVNALEDALAEHRADIAVHSMKDVPGTIADRFALTTFGVRADARDALVARQAQGLLDLPAGAVVGSSSGRRQAVLRHMRRDLDLQPLRGNVDTRLAKLEARECDAIVVACAGLDRLGHSKRITERLSVELMTPAPGQGVLAVEHLAERVDVANLLAPGTLAEVQTCATAERTVASALGADCTLPLGVHCLPVAGGFLLHASLFDAEGKREVRLQMQGDEAIALAQEAGRRLERLHAAEPPPPA